MIKELKWKFVAIMMGIVTILLLVIFGLMYYSSRMSYYQDSMSALRSGLTEPRRKSSPPAPPPSPETSANRLPLLVVDAAKDGSLDIITNRLLNVEEEDVKVLVAAATEKDGSTVTLDNANFRYRHERQRNGAVRYAFVDIYQEIYALHWQIIHSLIIGISSLAAFFLVAVYLSRWSVRPVEEAWEQQRQFTADASHELKTPLTVILSNISLLASAPDITDDRSRTRIEHIQMEAAHMKRLTENLLILARGDSLQNPDMEQISLDFSFLVDSSLSAFEPIAFDAGRRLETDVENSIRITGNPEKLRQLIEILLDNAIKYSADGSPISVCLRMNEAKETLLTVTSEGTPLSSEDCKLVFRRFYRADFSRSLVPGYGLGLSIAQSIVSEHRGRIEAASDGVKKNTFIVRLPLRRIVPRNSKVHEQTRAGRIT